MKKICEMVTNLLHVPYYLVPLLPCKDLSVQKHMVMSWRPPLRPSILELAEHLESSKGWALERTFGAWLNRQPWRKCLPPIYEFKSQFFRVLTHGMQRNCISPLRFEVDRVTWMDLVYILVFLGRSFAWLRRTHQSQRNRRLYELAFYFLMRFSQPSTTSTTANCSIPC